ncbi:YfgM family protein [Luteimonas sp. R10]|uniref:YfgM family protein n=1 Tax=Luteimonas sp. R10 TaxID=3108176 RepID=UPI003085D75A|nr:tetratricopeptide repeat protein [Luteimonas sp. R10]
MAIELLDEHEQGERVREWLRRNGFGLVAGVVLGLGLIGGWQWWQRHQHGARVQAGERYQATLASIQAGDLDAARTQARDLQKGGVYGTLIAFDLAKAEFEAGDHEAAIASLRQVADADPALEPIRRQRLARLLIDAGQAQEAASLLSDADDAVGLETLGDARFALDQRDQARQAYENALRRMDVAAPQRRLVELKLTQAGGKPSQPETI